MTEDPQKYDPSSADPTPVDVGEDTLTHANHHDEPAVVDPGPATEPPSEGTDHAAVPPAAVPPEQGQDMPELAERVPLTPATLNVPTKMCCGTCVYGHPTEPDPNYGYPRVICKWEPPKLFIVEKTPKTGKPGKLLRPSHPTDDNYRIVSSRNVMPAVEICGQWFEIEPEKMESRLRLLEGPQGQA